MTNTELYYALKNNEEIIKEMLSREQVPQNDIAEATEDCYLELLTKMEVGVKEVTPMTIKLAITMDLGAIVRKVAAQYNLLCFSA